MAGQQSARANVRVAGLLLCEELGRGASSAVYRAIGDGQEYTVKVAHRTIREERALLLEFRREASALAGFAHRGIPRVYDVGETDDGYPYFVMDFVSGQTLTARLSQGVLPPFEAAQLALRLAEILGVVHERGYVHQDVKPSNILVSAELEPTLVDFGLATRPRADNDNRTVGTFLYSAPEQTGLIKRSVDGRADLYALGVVLYECLTGAPPFSADDAAELLRLHATQKPRPLAEQVAHLDTRFASAIERLLSKDPDDRFSDAGALVDELGAIVGDESRSARRPHLNPKASAHAPLPWVGRAAVVEELVRVWSGSKSRRGSASGVRGAAGMGKSRLSEELDARAQKAGKRVMHVSCQVSGAALEPIRALVSATTHALAGDAKGALRDAAGDLLPYLVRLFPQLQEEHKSENSVEVGDADPALYYEAAARFLCRLVDRLGDTLWIIDDGHWLDLGSAKVLGAIARQVHTTPVHLLILCQPHESAVSTRVERELAGVLDAQVVLEDLSTEELAQLAVAHLGTGSLSEEFARELAIRAAGNPLTLREYLRAMIDAGVVWPRFGVWQVDRGALSELALPDDISELLLARLDHASEQTRKLLQTAALMGAEFHPSELALLAGADPAMLEGAVDEAVRVRLLDQPSEDRCRFLHELVRERLISHIPEVDRKELHRRVATILSARAAGDDALTFACAEHALLGTDEAFASEAYALVMQAAERALGSFAADHAHRLFASAEELARAHGLPITYELCLGLASSLSQNGQPLASMAWLDRAIALSQDSLDRAELHLRSAEAAFFGNNDLPRMRASLERGWHELGQEMPRAGFGAVLAWAVYMLAFLLVDLTKLGFGTARGRRKLRVLRRLGERTALLGLLTCQVSLMLKLGAVGNLAGLRIGPSPELVVSYASFGAGLAGMGFPRSTLEKYTRKAERVADEVGDPVARARAGQIYGAGLHFLGEMGEAESHLERLLATSSHVLPMADAGTLMLELCLGFLQRGYPQRARRIVERGSVLLRTAGPLGEREAKSLGGLLALALAIEGKTVEAREVYARIREPVTKDDPFRLFGATTNELWMNLEAGEFDVCNELFERQLLFRPATASWHIAYFWVLKCYVRLGQLERANDAQRAERVSLFRDALAELKLAGRHPLQRGHLLVLTAFDEHVRGQSTKAFATLNQAEDIGRKTDCPWVLFEAALLRAKVLRDQGRKVSCANEAEAALWRAQALGWTKRAERARGLMPTHRRTTSMRSSYASTNSASGLPGSAVTVARTRAQAAALTATRDRDALLQVGLATAFELEPGAQAKVALDKLLHVLGAERALFYAWDDEQKQLTVLAARDSEGHDLPADARVASSLIERVRRERAPLVLHGTEEGAALGSQSVVAENVRSMICAPVMLRDELLGVVYLDSRLAKGVFTKADLDILLGISNHIAIGQQMARSAQRELGRRALEKDLELTAAVQMLLLPKQPDAHFGHTRMVSLYRPASRSGGDFWGYETLPDGTLRVFLNDVTGHGAGAAMVTSTMAGAYRAFTQAKTVAVAPLLKEMDQVLSGVCDGRFAMTMSVVEIAPTGETTWWSAGAPPIVHATRDGRVSAKGSAGTPLRAGDLTIPVTHLTLAEGERLLLFSDAVLEQSMPNGKPVGMRRLMELMAEVRGQSIEQARDTLWSRLVELRGQRAQEDDITFVLIERTGS